MQICYIRLRTCKDYEPVAKENLKEQLGCSTRLNVIAAIEIINDSPLMVLCQINYQ